MDDPATSPGDPVDGGTQYGGGALWWKLDGSGNLVPDASRVLPDYLLWPLPDGLTNDYKVEVDWTIDGTFNSSLVTGVVGRAVIPFTTGGGGTAADILWNRVRGSGDVDSLHGNSVIQGDSYGVWADAGAGSYTSYFEMRSGGVGETRCMARLGEQASHGTYLASNNNGVGDGAVVDSTANLNDDGADYLYGIAGAALANTPAGLKIQAVRLLQFVEDTTGPVLGILTVPESGRCGVIPVIDTPNYSPPVLPRTGVTGLSFEASEDGLVWTDFPVTGDITITADTDYVGRIEFTFADTLPAGWQIRYSYDDVTGNITDSNDTPNAADAVTDSEGLNYSLFDPDAVSTKGEMFLGTQGFARTSLDPYDTNLQAQTLFPQELPIGASRGFTVDYLGYSDGSLESDDVTPKSIHIERAAIWVQQRPGEPRIKVRLTFNGGSLTCDIAANVIQESDPVDIDILPGAKVWTAQWYTDSDASTGLPYQEWIYTRELNGAGAEDQGGTLTHVAGAWTDYTLAGGFNHTITPPMGTGAYIARGYRPLAIKGLPHPSFVGTETVPCWIGDSINVLQNDYSPDTATPDMARGFNGRFCYNRFPCIIFGQAGSGSAGFRALEGTAIFQYIFGVDGAGRRVTDVHDEYGINGAIRTNPEVVGGAAENEWANRVLDAALVVKNQCNYVMSTITTFADSDVTGGSATVAKEQRNLFNWKVRNQWSEITGCKGYTDPCSLLEYDFKNGTNRYWDNTDGELHPDSTGHARYALTIDPVLFTGNPNPITSDFPALTVEVTEGGNVLTWPADVSATGYRISRASSTTGDATLLDVVDADTLTYTDTTPNNGLNVYFVDALP